MALDTTAIPQIVQSSAESARIAIPDGSTCGRIEPIFDSADWLAGQSVTVGARVLDAQGNTLGVWSDFTLQTGPLGDGNPPFLQIASAIASVGFSVVVSLSVPAPLNIGLRLCAAPDELSLPAPLPVPQ